MSIAFTLCLRGKHLRELRGISRQVRGVSIRDIGGKVPPCLFRAKRLKKPLTIYATVA